ncbi:hypothetical protein HOD08_00690 [bacterium]|nr:hypothetical protein [bacterium]
MHKKGSILVLALVFLSLAAFLAEQLTKSVTANAMMLKRLIAREHAQILALGGIQVAMAQLAPRAKTEDDARQIFFEKTFSSINRWQTFELNSKIDRFDSELKICISCEEGKLNPNLIFDFKKGEFKSPHKEILEKYQLPELRTSLDKLVGTALKKRKKFLNDLSQLDVDQKIKVFYEPPEPPRKNRRFEDGKRPLFLSDIFTLWNTKPTIHPLFLSDSMCALLELKRPRGGNNERLKESTKQLSMQIKTDWAQDWLSHWESFIPLFDKKTPSLEQLKESFSREIEPQVYSVLSLGRFNGVEQRLLAILVKNPQQAKQNKKEKDEKAAASNENVSAFKIVRLYWI